MHPHLKLICTVLKRYIQNRFLWHLRHHFIFTVEGDLCSLQAQWKRVMSLVRGSIKPTVTTHLCTMIQPSSQIHFILKQRHKQCCIYILNESFFIQNVHSLWPLVGKLMDFQKQVKEKLYAYLILVTVLNQQLY